MSYQGYIVDLRDQSKVTFQYLPEDIEVKRAVNTASSPVPLHSNPRNRPGPVSEHSYNFTLEFARYGSEEDEVSKATDRLLALTYPDNEHGVVEQTVPYVLLIFGEFVELVGLIKSVSLKYHTAFNPSGHPEHASASVVFEVVEDTVVNFKDVRDGAASRTGGTGDVDG
jgi:hypothetical protein